MQELSVQIPIAIMSFNRPIMLNSVLSSVARCISETNCFGEVYLFQDGNKNINNGEEVCSTQDINECIKVFKNHFPRGQVLLSEKNIGVAMNFDRAERFLFEEIGAPAALFFEDDMVLNSGYLSAIHKLIVFAIDNPDVGMVSCYGVSPTTPKEQQLERSAWLCHMGHNWGFAITQKHWKERDAVMVHYLSLVRGLDYRLRPQKDIGSWRESFGFPPEPTSQDDCKNIVSLRLGRLRLSTYCNFAEYIGVTGLHMTAGNFHELGYDRAVSINYTGGLLTFPTPAQLSDMLYLEVTSRFSGRLVDAQNQKKITPNMVKTAYRLLLDRNPEGEGAINGKLELPAPILLIANLMSSFEFRSKDGYGLDMCNVVLNRKSVYVRKDEEAYQISREDIFDAFELFTCESATEVEVKEILLAKFTRIELIRYLLSLERFKYYYIEALGTDNFFLTAS